MSGANVNIGQITVNVNDTIPPDNYATVDAGTKVGTVYTKEQNNAWRKEVEQNTNAGIKGIAKPDDTIVTTGFYRMLANTADTYTNYKDENDAPIVVTADDLNVLNGVQRNEVIIEVNNGVSEKKVFAKVGADGANGTAAIPHWMPDDYSPNAMVVDNFIQYIAPNGATATDVPGESSAWKVIGSKIELENEIIPTDQEKAVSGKAVADYIGEFDLSISQEKIIDYKNDTWKNGFLINPFTAAEEAAAAYRYLSFSVKKGDQIFMDMARASGVATFVFKSNVGSVINKFYTGNTDRLLTNEIIPSDGTLYFNQSISVPTVDVLEKIYLELEVEDNSTVIDYVDDKFKVSKGPDGAINIPLEIAQMNAYINLNSATIGSTTYHEYSANTDTDSTRLYAVAAGDIFYFTGKVAWSGISLFNNQGVLINKLLWSVSGATYTDREIVIPENGYMGLSISKSSTNALKKSVKSNVSVQELYDGSGSGSGSGWKVTDTMISAESYGVSASNTAANNTTILNTLLDQNKASGLPIYLPVGDIYVNNTLQYGSRNRLIGASWGGQNTDGTRLIATTPAPIINVFAVNPTSDIQDGQIQNIALDGNNIATKCMTIGELVAYFDMERIEFRRPTDVGLETVGALIYTLQRCRFMQVANGVRTRRTSDVQANLIKFTDVQFILNSGISCDIADGAQVVFNDCDWENVGSAGNPNTGAIKVRNMSPLGEGCDVSINNAWTEHIMGGFFLDIASSAGATVIRDSMLWDNSGKCQYGVNNNGSKVLLTGTTKIQGFATTSVQTSNNGQTLLDGFTSIQNHVETSGGTIKKASYINL